MHVLRPAADAYCVSLTWIPWQRQDEEDAAARAKKTDTTGPDDDDEHVADAAGVADAAEEQEGEEAGGQEQGEKEEADGGADRADGGKAEPKAQVSCGEVCRCEGQGLWGRQLLRADGLHVVLGAGVLWGGGMYRYVHP